MKNFSTEVRTRLNEWRQSWMFVLNVLITVLSYNVTLTIQQDLRSPDWFSFGQYWLPLAALCTSRMVFYSIFGINCRFWRHASAREASDILQAHVLSSFVFAVLIPILQVSNFGISLIFLELTFSLLIALGIRLGVRLGYEYRCHAGKSVRQFKDVVVLGAGPIGHLIVKTLQSPELSTSHLTPHVAAVFDDDPARQSLTVHGVKVAGGLDNLRSYLKRHPRVSAVHVAIEEIPNFKISLIKQLCEELHLSLKCVPMALDFSPEILDLQTLSVEELLQRNTSHNHKSELDLALKGKKVLVTGAGGSIGSELVRQLLQHELSELVLFDKSEYNLYAIEQELAKKFAGKACRIHYQLGNIVNEERLQRLVAVYRPHFIFHAAAYKHVPLLEQNCYEAFLNNVVGTMNLLKAAKENGVERFVFVSTDKAVEPSSVMGCTKRICELMVQQVNKWNAELSHKGGWKLETAAVRFGNVINSAGSVIPLFKKQILAGEAITITDEKVERYFMSIPEAANLILIAGLLGRNGEIYMLDMGDPIKIMDVAKKLRSFYGRRDLPIKIVGLRPGEKITEKLYYSEHEKRQKTEFEKVFSVCSEIISYEDVFNWVASVARNLNSFDDDEIGSILQGFIRGERTAGGIKSINVPKGWREKGQRGKGGEPSYYA